MFNNLELTYHIKKRVSFFIWRGKDRLISLEKSSYIKVSDMPKFPENEKNSILERIW